MNDALIRADDAMPTTQYSLADLAATTGVPGCLIEYYRQLGLLETTPAVITAPPNVRDLVNDEAFAYCAAEVGLTDHDIARLLSLNEEHDDLALRLAMTRMAELTRQQQLIAYVQGQLEVWIYARNVSAHGPPRQQHEQLNETPR